MEYVCDFVFFFALEFSAQFLACYSNDRINYYILYVLLFSFEAVFFCLSTPILCLTQEIPTWIVYRFSAHNRQILLHAYELLLLLCRNNYGQLLYGYGVNLNVYGKHVSALLARSLLTLRTCIGPDLKYVFLNVTQNHNL